MTPKQSKVVYTAVFGNYDHVSAVDSKWNCDFVCFTDNPEMAPLGWKVVVVKLIGELPSHANRRYKMMPHKYLSDYDESLYIDGNVKVLMDPSPLFEKYLRNGIIAISKHQDRDCVYEEAGVCIKDKRVEKEIVDKQMLRYAMEGFPKKFGMMENGVILRNHKNETVISLMLSWWKEYINGGQRDQLSLPYLSWKYDVKILVMVEGPRVSEKYFRIEFHEADKSKSLIARIVRKINSSKHLNWHSYYLSKIISIVVFMRNKFLFLIKNE